MSQASVEITQLDKSIERLEQSLDSLGKKMDATSKRPLLPKKSQQELNQMLQSINGFGSSLDQLNKQIANLNLGESLSKQFDGFAQRIITAIGNGFKNATQTVKNEGSGLAAEMEKSGKKAGDGLTKGIRQSTQAVGDEIKIILNQASRDARAAADLAGLRGLGRKGFVAAELFRAGADDQMVAERLGQAYVSVGKSLAGLTAEQIRATTSNAASVAQFKNAINAQKLAERELSNLEKSRAASASNIDARTLLGLPSEALVNSAKASAEVFKEAFAKEAARGRAASNIDVRTLLGLTSNSLGKSAQASAEVFKEAFAVETARGRSASNIDVRTLLGLTPDNLVKSAKASADVFSSAFAIEAARGRAASNIDVRTLLGLTPNSLGKSAQASAEVFKEAFAIEAAKGKAASNIDVRTLLGLTPSNVVKSAKASASVFVDAFNIEVARGKAASNIDVRTLLGLTPNSLGKSAQASAEVFKESFAKEVAKGRAASNIDVQTLLGLTPIRMEKSARASAEVFKEAFAASAATKQAVGGAKEFDFYGESAKKAASHVRLFTNDSRDALSAVRGLANGIGQALPIFGSLGPILAGTAVGAIAKKTVDVGSEVEYQIRFMKELGQVTSEQMGIVRSELRELDKESSFSISELSKNMVTLGQSGLTVAESFKLTRAASALATAGQVDLKVATDLLIQVNSLYGRSAEEADKTASMLFQATKSGVINVENLGNSFKYASETGSRFGKTLSESLVILNTLAQAGIKNSSGGTALINFFRDTNVRSEAARKQLAAFEDALNETRKAGEKPFKFTVFKDDGTQKSGLDILDELFTMLEKFTPEAADRFAQRFGSDRGFRTFFAAFREGTKTLREAQKAIEDIDPRAAFEAAKGLQDTVKGSASILSSTFVGVLDKVFEQYQDQIKGLVRTITQAIDSPEFKDGIKSIFGSLVSLAETIKQVYPVAETLLKVFLAYKAIQITTGIIQGFGGALAALPAMLTAVRVGTLGASTAVLGAIPAFQSKGAVMIANASAARAAANGMSEVGVATTRAGALAATSSGLMRGLATAVGFLGGPIGAIISALGLLGTAWFAMRDNANTAIQGINTDPILDQLDQIRRNALINAKGGDNPFAAVEVDLEQRKKSISDLEKRIQSLKAQATPVQISVYVEGGENIIEAGQSTRELNAAYKELNTQKQALIAAEKKLGQTRKEVEAIPKAKPVNQPGVLGTPGGLDPFAGKKGSKGSKGPKEEVQEQRRRYADLLSAYTEEFNKSKQTLDQQLRQDTQKLSAQLDAKMISQGQYNAEVLALTVKNEQDQLAVIKKYEEDSIRVVAQAREEIKTLKKGYGEALSEIDEAEKKSQVTIRESTKQLSNAIAFRQELANISGYKRINEDAAAMDKAEQSLKAYNTELELNAKAISESVELTEAERKGLEAKAAFTSKFASTLEELRKRGEEAKSSVDSYAEAIEQATAKGDTKLVNELSAEWVLAKAALDRYLERRETLAKGVEEGAEVQRARAVKNELIKEFNELNKDIKDKLTDAIINAGKDGGAGLKDTLKNIFADFAKQKFRVVIDAVLNPISSAIASFINPTAAAAAGQSGGGGLSSLSGITDFYKKVNSNISNGISDGFKKLSESAIGEKLGLSNFGEGPGVFTQTALGKTLGSAISRLGSTFAGFTAGNALNSGISNGFSISKGANVAGQLATVVASFFGGPVGGAIAGAIAGGINRLFGRKLRDSGIQGTFGGQAGFQGNSFQFLKGGLFRSDKTVLGDLDPAVVNQLADSFQKVQVQAALAAQTLGLDSNAIANFTKEIKLSFKDLTEEEIEQKLQAELESLGNELADLVLKTRDYTIGNESSLQTLTRLAETLGPVNASLKVLGAQLFDTSLAGADLATQLADIFGGIEQFTAATAQFYQTFFTEEERLQQTRQDIITRFRQIAANGGFNDTMKELEALLNNITRETFRDLVLAQDLTTESGRKTFRELLALSEGFAQLVGPTNDATEAIEKNTKAQDERRRLEERLLTLQGNTAELRRRELEALDASNRPLLEQIFALEDAKEAAEKAKEAQEKYTQALEEAKSKLEAAKEAVKSIQDRILSIQERGTSRYLDAQQRVADAQAAIAELSKEASSSLEDFAKSIREFVRDQIIDTPDNQVGFGAAKQTFQKILEKAMAGDGEAFGKLTDAAGTLLEKAKATAGSPEEFRATQRRVLQQLNAAAAANEAALAAQVNNPEEDPLIKANKELMDAQAELAEATRIANAINAPLVKQQEDLIKEYTDALAELADATEELNKAQEALDKIVANTDGIVPAISDLALSIKEAGINAKLEADALIKFIVDQSDLPADLKKIAVDGVGTIQALIKFAVDTNELPDDLRLLAIQTSTDLTKTIDFIVRGDLPEDLKKIALLQTNTLTATVLAVLGSDTPDELKGLLLGTASRLTKSVAFVVESNLPDDLKRIALEQTNTFTATLRTVLADNVPDSIKSAFLTGSTTFTALITAIAGSDMSDAIKRVLFQGTGTYTTTLSAIVDSNTDEETKQLLLQGNTTALRAITLRTALESALTPDQRRLLDQTNEDVRKIINATLNAPPISEEARTLLAQTNATISRVVNASVNGQISADGRLLLQEQGGNITKAITAGVNTSTISADGRQILNAVNESVRKTVDAFVSTGNVTEDARLLLQQVSTNVTKAVNASVNTSNLSADGRLVLAQVNENIQKTINAAVSTSQITSDGRQILAQANETVSKTIQALVNDSSLTESQRSILRAISGNSSSTLNLSGNVVFDPSNALQSVFNAIQQNTSQALNIATVQTRELSGRLDTIAGNTNRGATEAFNLAARASGQNNGLYMQFARGGGPGQNVYATGAAFTNGVVKRPTLFNESLMGEAGPEAIMPLTNIGGKLGVRAVQSPTPVGDQTAIMNALLREIMSMKAEITDLKFRNSSENQAAAISMANLSRLAKRWDQEGLTVRTEDGVPFEVEVVAP